MAAMKIVIVSGQEFQVPADTNNEAIRKHLATQFPEVATAEICKGHKTIDGQQFETIEFVKKAGTKGINTQQLTALFTQVPPTIVQPVAPLPATFEHLLAGTLTYAQVLDDSELAITVREIEVNVVAPETQGVAQLCNALDTLPACAADLHAW